MVVHDCGAALPAVSVGSNDSQFHIVCLGASFMPLQRSRRNPVDAACGTDELAQFPYLARHFGRRLRSLRK